MCGQTDVIVAGNLKCKRVYCLVKEGVAGAHPADTQGGGGAESLPSVPGQAEHDESASVPVGMNVIVEAD